jgi:cell division protein ZapA (FtsZ GTPase activity inhibitor)
MRIAWVAEESGVENTEKRRVSLTICGVDYVLLCEKDEEYMRALGANLHEAMTRMLRENGRVSATQAAVLCALQSMDEARESQTSAENLRARIQDYLEDAAQMKKEAEFSRHEAERLHREIAELKKKL